jgi:hypothetical protein
MTVLGVMMRLTLVLLGVLAVAGCQEAPQAHKESLPLPPAREAGLWTFTVNSEGVTQASRLCLNALVEAKIARFAAPAPGGACAGQKAARQPDGSWRFDSVCDFGSGGVVMTLGTATGDASKRYHVDATTETSGAGAPQMNGERKMTLDAAWTGPCPAGMKPGELELDGGLKVDLLGG